MKALKYVETGLYAALTLVFVGAALYWFVFHLIPSLFGSTGDIPLTVIFGLSLAALLFLGWVARNNEKD